MLNKVPEASDATRVALTTTRTTVVALVVYLTVTRRDLTNAQPA